MEKQNEKKTIYSHWRLATDVDNIAWLTFDRNGASVNSLDVRVFIELEDILHQFKNTPPLGLVILSGKKKGYIAGADIKQFTEINDSNEAYNIVRQAQLILNQLENLPFPTVAAIHGFCLGGGLEFALACRYRIATEDGDTLLGLPEVKLGLHPGFGGTVRLPRLIGAKQAIPLMLMGRSLTARQSLKCGLVDLVVYNRNIQRAARDLILHKPAPKKPRGLSWLSNALVLRDPLAQFFNWQLKKSIIGKVSSIHYPAPYKLIRNWRQDRSFKKALDREAQSIAELMVGDTSRQLVRLFFLQEELKNLGRKNTYKLRHVHVVGAGSMGADIAAWCALQGFNVTLQDQGPEPIARAIKKAYILFTQKLKLPHLIRAASDRLLADIQGDGISKADVIIEAAFEKLSVKQDIFKMLESKARPDALLATNTSSIPLAEIASVLFNPQRLVGLHFFNPVDKMQLVEVVRQDEQETLEILQAMAFVTQLKRLPLPVKSAPGFLVNRLLMPYLLEAVTLLQEGIDLAVIDRAAEHFGMPIGPIALADQVGLDICLSVAENLSQHYSFPIPDLLKKMVSEGYLGKKSGRGFYAYSAAGKPIKQSSSKTEIVTDHLDRLLLRLLNEAVATRLEGIVASNDLVDAGMVFGTGFAPFYGGPMQYINKCGQAEIQERLNQLSQTYGERFTPHAGWQQFKNE